MEAGLNLYSVRTLAKSESDLSRLCDELRNMGYSYIQVSGISLKSDEIARASKGSGLPVRLTHSSLDAVLNEPQKLMDDNAVFGNTNIGIGYFPADIIADRARLTETASRLESVAQKMQENGFMLFIHHHSHEFYKHDNEIALDILLERAPDLHVIADTYWLQYGGVEPAEYIKSLNGRTECVHLKDYRVVKRDGGMSPRFAPVGSGTLDFKKIVDACKGSGTMYYLVEQDDACDYDDPLGQVEQSIEYIKSYL